MRVSIKTGLATAVGLMALGAVGGSAAAQCNSGCTPTPPACCTTPPAPPAPPSPPGGCCTAPPPPTYPGGGNYGGNINVNVNVNANGNANANANANSSANGYVNAHGYTGLIGGGGGGSAYFSVEQPYPTLVQGLNVEAAAVSQVIQVPYEAVRWSAGRVVIRAVCMDDRNIPHPASQVIPGQDVAEGYEGELYRCIAGTFMQYTFADFLGQVNFEQGQTISCRKGESLWYGRGGGEAAAYAAQYAEAYAQTYAQGGMQGEGQGGMMMSGGPATPMGGGVIECRPQRPERDCNERSLLRRYGAGVKVLTMWREERYTEYREEVVQSAGMAVSGASLTLDGGVGGRVF